MLFHQLLGFVFVVIILCIVIGVPYLFLFGGADRFLKRPLQRRYTGLIVRDQGEVGDVEIVYHTYRGLLIWVTQDEHRKFGPPNDMRMLLRRLRNWNLSWGLLSYGCLLIPLLAVVNYRSQLKSIEHQLTLTNPCVGHGGLETSSWETSSWETSSWETSSWETSGSPEQPTQTSRFHQIVGYTAAVLAVLFGCSAVYMLTKREFGTAAANAFVSLLLGDVAKDWISSNPSEAA